MSFKFSNSNKRYHTLDYHLKTRFCKKVFKVPLNAGFSCPNIDGSKGYGGCIFCLNGSGEFAGNKNENLFTQFDNISNALHEKWPEADYIVYFQANTNTYANVDVLKSKFDQFINKDKVVGLSIATRPDCINGEIVAYLKQLSSNFKLFWIELGLQTMHDETAKYINRGYYYDEFLSAVKLLRNNNIEVIIHIINSLPNEDETMMLDTVKALNELDIQGVKLHMLHILKGTKIVNTDYKLLTEDEFINITIKQIRLLKPEIVIHRIGADAGIDNLIEPFFTQKKLNLTNKIDVIMKNNDYFQGDLL